MLRCVRRAHSGRFVQLLLAKLPNVVSIESRPFDSENHELEQPRVVQEEESELGGPRKMVRLTSENVIRWRVGTDAKGNKIVSGACSLCALRSSC